MPARSSLSGALAGRLAALASVPRSTKGGRVLKFISKIASNFFRFTYFFSFWLCGVFMAAGAFPRCGAQASHRRDLS